MKKYKLDIIFAVDCSDKLKSKESAIESIISDCIRSLKGHPDFCSYDISLSLVSFSDEINRELTFEFKPLNEVCDKFDLGDFGGSPNPGPALEGIASKAVKRYENWVKKGDMCCSPILLFFTAGVDGLKDEYNSAYEKFEKYVEEMKDEHSLFIYPVVIGAGSDGFDSLKPLTYTKENIFEATGCLNADEKLGSWLANEVLERTVVGHQSQVYFVSQDPELNCDSAYDDDTSIGDNTNFENIFKMFGEE